MVTHPETEDSFEKEKDSNLLPFLDELSSLKNPIESFGKATSAFYSLHDSISDMYKKYDGYYGWYEDSNGDTCQIGTVSINGRVESISFRNDAKNIFERLTFKNGGFTLNGVPISFEKVLTEIIPFLNSKLKEWEQYEETPEKVRDKNYRKNENESNYRKIVDKCFEVSDEDILDDSRTYLDMSKYINYSDVKKVLEESGIIFKGDWKVENVSTHVGNHPSNHDERIKGVSVKVSFGEGRSETYEIWPDLKILQRQDGVWKRLFHKN